MERAMLGMASNHPGKGGETGGQRMLCHWPGGASVEAGGTLRSSAFAYV